MDESFVAGALVLSCVGGYLLGSVPFGLILTRPLGIDVRAIGSGNIGATNVLRSGRKGLALATLLLDSGKGAGAALIAGAVLGMEGALAAGLGAVLGHNFPIWLRFSGGKGVAATLGVLLATVWPVGAASCLTWLVVAALTRYSSLAALTALTLAPFYAVVLVDLEPPYGPVLTYSFLALLAAARHRENIARLLRGTETKIGQKRS